MKKFYLTVLMLFTSISMFSQTEVFDWFFPSDLSATPPSQSLTVAGITSTYTAANTIVSDPDGQGGPMVLVSGPQSSTTTSVNITFSSPVDLISLRALEFTGGRSWIFTPIGGSNSSVTSPIAAANFTTNVRTLVNLNWTGITGFTISRNGGGASAFPVDQFVIASGPSNTVPVIGGAAAGQTTNDNSNINLFSNITISDADRDSVTATITLDSNAKGILTGNGLSGTGPYTISSRSPAALENTLRGLSYNPTDNRSSISETTTFTLAINDGTATTSNNTTTVISNAVPPSVSSIAVVGNPSASSSSVSFLISFTENVTGVDVNDFSVDGNGSVTGNITGITGSGNIRTVTVTSVTGTGTLSIDLNNSSTSITDAGGAAISGGFTAGNVHVVDTNGPVITGVAVPANGSYSEGQNIDFNVTFSEPVDVITTGGVPQIGVNIGGIIRQASYIIGSGNTVIAFRYVVQSGETDTDGIQVGTLTSNGGVLRDTAGNDANLNLNNVGSTTDVLIDTTAPSITSVLVPANANYMAGQNLSFIVNFNEDVNLTGAPELAITIGTVVRQATFSGGSGTSALLFRYTVQAGEIDTDGIEVGTLTTNGGAIRDAGSNDANLTLNNLGSTTGVLVDSRIELVITGLIGDDKTYDGTSNASISGTGSLSGVVSGDDVALVGTPTFAFSNANVGIGKAIVAINNTGYTITGTDAFKYTLTEPSISADINPRAITITAQTQTKIYGNALSLDTTAFLVTDLDGDGILPNGESIDAVSLSSASGVDASTTAAVGTYTDEILITTQTGSNGFDAANYTFSYTAGDFVVNTRAITLAAQTQTKIYGNALSLDTTAFLVTDLDGDGMLPNGEFIDAVSLSSASGVDASTTAAVGTYADEILITTQTGSNGFDAANYMFTYTAGDFVVNTRAITLAAQTQTKIYGNALSLDTTAFLVTDLDGDGMLPNGEFIDAVSLSSASGVDASTTAAVGTYTDEILITTQTGSNGFDAANYTFSYTAGDLVVNTRAITLAAQNQSKIYGNVLSLDTTAFTLTDLDGDGMLPNGEFIDTVSLSSVSGIAASTTAAAGIYTDEILITSQTGSNGFDAANYMFTYTAGDLVVNARAITLTAQPQSKIYGTVLTLDTTAFLVTDLDGDGMLPNGESIDAVSLSSASGVDASTTAAVGTYADEILITSQTGSNGFDAANYMFTYTASDLVVNTRAITISAQTQSKIYGNVLSLDTTAFTLTDLDGDGILPNGEFIDTVSLSSVSGIAASTTAAAGTYTDEILITSQTGSNGFDAANYTFSYTAGDLVVNARAITITAQLQNKIYGNALSLDTTAFTLTDLDGDGILPNSELIDAVSLSSASGVDASTTAAVGTYTDEILITSQTGSNGFDAANYTISYTAGDLVVNARAITITAQPQNKIYGTALTLDTTAFTLTDLDGDGILPNGELIDAVSVSSTLGLDVSATAAVGIYPDDLVITSQIGSNGFNPTNYLFSYISADFEILPATQTGLVFADNTFTYDGSIKSLSVTGQGSNAVVTYTNNDKINAGVYAVTAMVTRPNFTTAVLNATLTIDKAVAIINTNAVQSFVYDGTLKNVTASLNHTETSLTYTPQQGFINAGSYQITVMAAETPNYLGASSAVQLIIDRAPQTIVFNALNTRSLENDPDFQLDATASSGLPVSYSFTFTSPQPAATVSPSGFVSLQTSGQIQIFAAQAGNANYEPATSVEQALNITSSNAEASQIIIDGQVYNNPSSVVYYLIDCDNFVQAVDVSLTAETNAILNPSTNFSIDAPVPGVYTQVVEITSQDGTQTRNYTIVVEKAFDFDAIIVQKYNNTLVVNNNPLTNEGYSFVSYKWYKNGRLVGEEQSFSEGENASDRLDPSATYQAVMVTTDGDELRTCVFNVQLTPSQGLTLNQNPVSQGENLQAIAQYSAAELDSAMFHVYDLNGRLLLSAPVTGVQNSIELPNNLPVGVYKLILITNQRSEHVNFIRN